MLAQAAAGEIDGCLIHLAEGVDESSRSELDQLEALGMLQPWTVIVHGTPFGPDELDRVAAAEADLVWSPTSNLRLYGRDARADLALARGINTSLSTDWRLSGDHNLLQSLKVAWELNVERSRERETFSPSYQRFTEYELVEMVTVNPSKSLGWENRTGRLRVGLAADLLVVSAPPWGAALPYRALIRATEADVRLVMVGGDALYGDPDLMGVLKPGDHEFLSGPGFTKAIDVTRDGVDRGWQTLADLRGALESTMAFELPAMYATFPVVPDHRGNHRQPLDLPTFAFLFGLVFPDYLPPGASFPPSPADLGVLFTPGALSAPLNPIYPEESP